ncbi:endonuclease III [Candidatus Pacearchaeota archaeon]|nr:endonuclease III [Candidatus Pacearchaeota archaeon]
MKQSKAVKQLLAIKKLGKSMRLAAEDWKFQWQTLIAIILSARTRDEVTIKVCKKLFNKYKNLSELSNAKTENISKIIKPINFYKNKTKNIKNCSKTLIEKFNGKIPHNLELLISLPGVGRKTANVFLSEHKHDAIGVDTHVSYISQKLKWVKNNKPHKIEKELENLFPKYYWNKINLYLVKFGKTYTSRRKKNEILNQIIKIK